MEFNYRRANIGDIDLLTKTRIKVLRAANQLDQSADLSLIERESYQYYSTALKDGSHVAFLVFDGEILAAAGGVCFFRVLPTCGNPSGKKAYIMNMYTSPPYRRLGIACKTLDLLVEEARSREISHIFLEATDMGKPLYEKYGFLKMDHEMILPDRR